MLPVCKDLGPHVVSSRLGTVVAAQRLVWVVNRFPVHELKGTRRLFLKIVLPLTYHVPQASLSQHDTTAKRGPDRYTVLVETDNTQRDPRGESSNTNTSSYRG